MLAREFAIPPPDAGAHPGMVQQFAHDNAREQSKKQLKQAHHIKNPFSVSFRIVSV
jgi:hypothetical protein